MHAAMGRMCGGARRAHDKAISFDIGNGNGTSCRASIVGFLSAVNEARRELCGQNELKSYLCVDSYRPRTIVSPVLTSAARKTRRYIMQHTHTQIIRFCEIKFPPLLCKDVTRIDIQATTLMSL